MEKTRITDLDLARLFLEKNEKEQIISEVFRFFAFDCLERCSVNPDELDSRIRAFEQNECSDPEALADVIRLIRSGQEGVRKKAQALVKTIQDAVSTHLHENMTVEQLAQELHLSYYHMCHFFKSRTGITVHTFRTQKRMEYAMKLLLGTNEKIADIATECGYNNISYFTETFTKLVGMPPAVFREQARKTPVHEFYCFEDLLAASRMPSLSLLENLMEQAAVDTAPIAVHLPDERFRFLHEAAIIEYHGVLYASWYNCPQKELQGYTPICGKRSRDGGRTWSELEIIADDPTGQILYCPPVYGIDNDRLYMLMNQMVAPDHIHSLDLYCLNPETDAFELCWSRSIPFKLNTNVVTLPNGKRMLPGRMGELDGFPNTPAVLISDSGRIDAEWRLVKIAENGDLWDGKQLVHPELSVICAQNTLYMFCRNDQSRVPLVYLSQDCGETWSAPYSHDLPYVSSKIYCGDLSDGRHYLIANTDRFNRSKLSVYLTADTTLRFTKEIVLMDAGENAEGGACHYPAACEADGRLYIIATIGYEQGQRGASLFTINL